MDHDQRFKAMLREFFPDFLRLFFPEWAARFDLTRIEWADQELLPDPPDGERHVLDLVAKVRAVESPDGTPTPPADGWAVLVHVEVESPDRTPELRPRLPRYYRHLRDRYGLKVLPLALYLNVGLNGIGEDTVDDALFGYVVNTFRYFYVGLVALDAETYLRGENPLGVALSALMRMPRERAVQVGVEAMRRIGEAEGLTDQQRYILGDCVESYLPVDEAESRRFHAILEANATKGVPVVNKTRYDLAVEAGEVKGEAKGEAKGEVRALRAAVCELLEAKTGPLPPDLAERVIASTDPAALRKWLLAAGTSDTLAAFRVASGL